MLAKWYKQYAAMSTLTKEINGLQKSTEPKNRWRYCIIENTVKALSVPLGILVAKSQQLSNIS